MLVAISQDMENQLLNSWVEHLKKLDNGGFVSADFISMIDEGWDFSELRSIYEYKCKLRGHIPLP